MSEETIHESRRTRSKRAIATYFRRVANALNRGEPVPVDDEQTVTVEMPDEPELDVELTRDGDDLTVDIQMEWVEEDDDVDTEASASKATFQLYEDKSEQWRWRLRHDNGNIIADGSEGYASKQKAKQGLESVKKNAPGGKVIDTTKDDPEDEADEEGTSATFELFEDKSEQWRWRLVHRNGNIIGDGGQGYASKQKAKQGLQSVKLNAPGAEVEEVEA